MFFSFLFGLYPFSHLVSSPLSLSLSFFLSFFFSLSYFLSFFSSSSSCLSFRMALRELVAPECGGDNAAVQLVKRMGRQRMQPGAGPRHAAAAAAPAGFVDEQYVQ